MPNIGPAEILLILIVALVVFGPRKLPELGKSLGNGLREFRKGTAGLKAELDGGLRESVPAPVVMDVQPVAAAVAPSAVTPRAPQA
ncbi:Sec-independent protein translocase subunit TatA/TatB [Deinococcus aquatilis]|jgi:sec-independent protein translocase protein TatA|uniref:Sec-independent protein translocase subunit TatA/TatB n=1 Tax=Deinococcus aquatilis TaxID=519440 RepID=UPI000362DE32|nr:twin-arginine translocase TatA/TatE family subunit [Deinococcus aquatilis]